MALPNGKTMELNSTASIPTNTPLPVSQCRTTAELERTLVGLSAEDDAVTARLSALLSVQEGLNRSLSRLDLLRAHLGTQVVAARSLSNEILASTAATASRVSSAVRALDIEQARVKATLEVVEQVVELKACVLGVTGSMGAPQDWETAASYLHRASKIPEEIATGEFAEEMVPTAEVPDPPSVTLHNAAESLCGLFLRQFERAAAANPPDGEKITRFFKLFPLIGRAEVGLDVYGKYVCTGISSRARATLGNKPEGPGAAFFYANAITRLFEHIAGIVEQHSPLVERHYGKGRMGRVIMRVQREADLQGGIILDAWGEEREVDRKITETKSYAFTFLVQSFLHNSRNPAAPQRTGSPAGGAGTSGGVTGAGPQVDGDGTDVKEVDMILLEIGAMLSRWSLYCRFMARKFLETEDLPLAIASTTTASSEPPSRPPLTFPPVLIDSALSAKISDRLLIPFQTLTTFFIRRTVEKAFQLDEAPSDLLPLPLYHPAHPPGGYPHPPPNSPFITSAVDDVMYIVNKLVHRALHTSQRTLVVSVLSSVSRVLGSDFIGVIQRRMRDECYPKPVASNTTIIVGNPAASLAQAMATVVDDRAVQFMVLINNLDIAAEYCRRIISTFLNQAVGTSTTSPTAEQPPPPAAYGDESAPTPLPDLFPFAQDFPHVCTALQNVSSAFDTKSTEVLSDAVLTLFNQLIKSKLRPLITESFRDIDYSLLEPSTTAAAAAAASSSAGMASISSDPSSSAPDEDEEIVKSRFTHAFSTLIHPFKYVLTDTAFTRLLSFTATYLARLLEKKLFSLSSSTGVSELGAIRLERDIAWLVGAVVKVGRYGVRETFVKCVQICLVLNVDEEEVGSLWEEGDEGRMGVEWRLSVDERRRARGMLRR